MTSEQPRFKSVSQTIVIASRNPVKIRAAHEGFVRMFPNNTYEIRGISVASGVPDQPFSEDETLLGAVNRVKNIQALEPAADFWVGIEGGVAEHHGSLQSFAWVVVMDKEGQRMGKARTAAYYLPEETANLVRNGTELGHADEIVFGSTNSKQGIGSVGLLTDKVIDRSGYYIQAVILALIPFKNSSLTFLA